MGSNNKTIYIGNLPRDAIESDVELIFQKYGKISRIEVKDAKCFAFVEFNRRQDALEAVRGRNGYLLGDKVLKVSFAHNRRVTTSAAPVGHMKYRVLVKNLPETVTWQELKRHAGMAGRVCYAQIHADGSGQAGVVDYPSEEVMRYALEKLDHTEFRNFTSRSIITVSEYDGRYSLVQQDDGQQVVDEDKCSRAEVGESPHSSSPTSPKGQPKHLRSELKGDSPSSSPSSKGQQKRSRSDLKGNSPPGRSPSPKGQRKRSRSEPKGNSPSRSSLSSKGQEKRSRSELEGDSPSRSSLCSKGQQKHSRSELKDDSLSRSSLSSKGGQKRSRSELKGDSPSRSPSMPNKCARV